MGKARREKKPGIGREEKKRKRKENQMRSNGGRECKQGEKERRCGGESRGGNRIEILET